MLVLTGSETKLHDLLRGLAAVRGVSTGKALAQRMKEAGHETSQQSCSDFLRGDRVPSEKWLIGYIEALGLEGEQRKELILAWAHENPETYALYRLWAES